MKRSICTSLFATATWSFQTNFIAAFPNHKCFLAPRGSTKRQLSREQWPLEKILHECHTGESNTSAILHSIHFHLLVAVGKKKSPTNWHLYLCCPDMKGIQESRKLWRSSPWSDVLQPLCERLMAQSNKSGIYLQRPTGRWFFLTVPWTDKRS